MFERFTDPARHTVVAAQEEARDLGHAYIGTEHLLLGLLHEPDGVAARALYELGVVLPTTRTHLEEMIGCGGASPSGHIPFTPRSKEVLELSLREALGLGHNYIGTEHILLGIAHEGEGAAIQLLARQGATAERVRQAVLRHVQGATTGPRPMARPRAARTPGAESVILAAEELAGAGPVGTHHLLEAIALLDGSLANNTLTALGLDREAIAAKIDELGVDGTSDTTAEVSAARQMEIHRDAGAVRIVLRDDVSGGLVDRLVAAAGNPISGADGSGSALVGMWQAVVASLQQLTTPLEQVQPDDVQSRSAIVRGAIHNRRRRRNG